MVFDFDERVYKFCLGCRSLVLLQEPSSALRRVCNEPSDLTNLLKYVPSMVGYELTSASGLLVSFL
jgi:hypothetical protein